MDKRLEQALPKKESWMAYTHPKRCSSISIESGKCKLNWKMSFHIHQGGKNVRFNIIQAAEDVKYLYTAVWNINYYRYLENNLILHNNFECVNEHWFSIPLLGIYPRKCLTCPPEDTYKSICMSMLSMGSRKNKPETDQMPVNRKGLNKLCCINKIYCSHTVTWIISLS